MMICQTMNPSLSDQDELAEIELSARGVSLSPQTNNNSSLNNITASGNRTSSMGSVDTYNSTDFEKGDLLVNFPSQGAFTSYQAIDGHDNGTSSTFSSSGKAKQRNSVSVNPLFMRSAIAGLADLVDSDSDDDDDDCHKHAKKNKRPFPPPASNPKASGGPEHRPLVGGFAAAAYEAARVDYYNKQGLSVRGHNTSRPRSHYPRSSQYP
mmetsp:Transcript_16016/g.33869  ORF Transcript_16016/g.33869 Transcript_16016/m.33869 type:complete len:209 (+) Transcript_16016:161-787(+)